MTTNKRLATKGEYTVMYWNHANKSTESGKFAFFPDQETAETFARKHCACLAGNQAQVSLTGVYPIKVTLRLHNNGNGVQVLSA